MAGAAPGADLGEPLVDGYGLAVEAGGHVAAGERVVQVTGRLRELAVWSRRWRGRVRSRAPTPRMRTTWSDRRSREP